MLPAIKNFSRLGSCEFNQHKKQRVRNAVVVETERHIIETVIEFGVRSTLTPVQLLTHW